MPLRDVLAVQPETVQHLWLAAEDRMREARYLESAEPAGSMYLGGYVAEMSLKVAALRFFGAGPADEVRGRLAPARARATVLLGEIDDENYHSVLFWALLLVATRRHAGRPLARPLSNELTGRARRVHQQWTVSMRYRPLPRNAEDATSFLRDVGWIRERAPELWR